MYTVEPQPQPNGLFTLPSDLPVDVQGYLIEAALELFAESKVQTREEQDIKDWMAQEGQFEKIIERARELQIETWNKFSYYRKPLTRILSNRVWVKAQQKQQSEQTKQNA